MRIESNTNQFFKTKAIEKNRIWLNLSNSIAPINQMMVAYMSGATQDIDQSIDGRYINDSPTSLNSLINSEEFAIQGRALPFDGTDVVPLAFKTTMAGDFTIAIDHVDGLFSGSTQDIILKDNITGVETDLKAGGYTFTAAAGVDNARFALKYQKTLNINAPAFNDNSVRIYKNKGTLYVNSSAVTMANIKIFDIQGRLLAEQKNVNENIAEFKDLKTADVVLIVKITSIDADVVIKKIFN
jgi:NACalpha-BTF3-like transcription factor